MCGIAGFWDAAGGWAAERLAATAGAMASTLVHRGPDDSGVWVDAPTGIALGHRRLSVIDLSPSGHQPMTSRSGRWVISFNGEIYNFLELRRALERDAASFRGSSDTEVLVEAIDRWGFDHALRRANGMFALAAWDSVDRRLMLARDRIGEKPLFYGRIGRGLAFASELKAFRPHPQFSPEIDRDAAAAYFRYGYVPSPRSIYLGINKLPPGHLLQIDSPLDEAPAPRPYWSVPEVAPRRSARDPDAALEELDALLRDSVRLRMLADVPVGALLSGGIDSSAVVAIAQSEASKPVRTFAVGFASADYDEAPWARAVAAHLGTDHTELIVQPADALAVIPSLPHVFDEPFGDSSQIPTLLVANLARRSVTVGLTGDGGDELFGGYDRYTRLAPALERLIAVPGPVTGALAAASRSLASAAGDGRSRGAHAPVAFRAASWPERLDKLGRLLELRTSERIGAYLSSIWQEPEDLVIGAGDSPSKLAGAHMQPGGIAETLMRWDQTHYLPDDLLAKVDRATMAVSLESRLPLLDHRIVAFAASLPLELKIRRGVGKLPLRRLLARHLPVELFDRPKQGFALPIGDWLRDPLREWAESLLSASRLDAQGIVRTDPVRATWAAHLAGSRDHSACLWTVLMFSAWMEAEALPSLPASSEGAGVVTKENP